MTDGRIPEGRKPLTDADIAALTRRLAGTAVDYKELYEAAKRDAEEAEAYAAELEKERDDARAYAAEVRIREKAADDARIAAEAKLAKAVGALRLARDAINGLTDSGDAFDDICITLAELKGQDDE